MPVGCRLSLQISAFDSPERCVWESMFLVEASFEKEAGRASFRVVPKFVLDDWGIESPKERIW